MVTLNTDSVNNEQKVITQGFGSAGLQLECTLSQLFHFSYEGTTVELIWKATWKRKASSQQPSQASSSASSAAGRATSPTAANRAAAASARRPSPVNTDRPASPATARPTAPPDSNRPNPSAAPVTSRPTTAASPSRRVTPPRQTFTPPRTTANRPQPSTSGPSDVKNTYQASNFPPPAGIPYSSRDVSPGFRRRRSSLSTHHHRGARPTVQAAPPVVIPTPVRVEQNQPENAQPSEGTCIPLSLIHTVPSISKRHTFHIRGIQSTEAFLNQTNGRLSVFEERGQRGLKLRWQQEAGALPRAPTSGRCGSSFRSVTRSSDPTVHAAKAGCFSIVEERGRL
ncbi:unnamed protein product [Nesidiocoris tenuis]|uniref:Uncharacterized protein n=1 Tax=Nesidiocoris tenuis TaxID=355587 RepID=A0A6H5G0U2_9HEMI|nr:unnamed protein product [Nesidiocoris tenuis]